jgi:triacylglycerol lipase
MISRLGMGHRVSALVTISSPHRGSAYYDYLLARLGPLGRIEGLRDAVVDLRALWQVSMAHSIAFNQQVPDMPSVRYCSVTAACGRDRVPLFLRPAYEWIREIQGENDGLVAASSSRWGLELAHWPVHHLHQINHPLRPLSPPSREDIRPRYLQLLSLLNAEGILEPPAGEARPVAPEPAGIF